MQKNNQIQNISFIGSGNVSTHLAVALKKAGLNIYEVYSPNKAHAIQFSAITGSEIAYKLNELDINADLYLICVPDAKVKTVCDQLPECKGIVAHTSGITPLNALQSTLNYGVLYPLQTFTKNKTLDMNEVPFCIEGSDVETTNKLMAVSKRISKNVYLVNSEDRRFLHLTAVMVNNFTNHLYHIAEDVLKNKGIDFNLLLPLIKETAAKVEAMKPGDAQTGPAKRNDHSTIDEHIDMLKEMPDYGELYRIFSEQIKKKHHG